MLSESESEIVGLAGEPGVDHRSERQGAVLHERKRDQTISDVVSPMPAEGRQVGREADQEHPGPWMVFPQPIG